MLIKMNESHNYILDLPVFIDVNSTTQHNTTQLVNARIQASIVAAVLSDAAAMGVQWVYDGDLRQKLEATAIRRGACGLDFLDPPANMFFTYDSGRNRLAIFVKYYLNTHGYL